MFNASEVEYISGTLSSMSQNQQKIIRCKIKTNQKREKKPLATCCAFCSIKIILCTEVKKRIWKSKVDAKHCTIASNFVAITIHACFNTMKNKSCTTKRRLVMHVSTFASKVLKRTHCLKARFKNIEQMQKFDCYLEVDGWLAQWFPDCRLFWPRRVLRPCRYRYCRCLRTQ